MPETSAQRIYLLADTLGSSDAVWFEVLGLSETMSLQLLTECKTES